MSPVLVKTQHISNVCSQSTRFSVTSACKNNISPMFVVSQHVSVSPVLVGTQHISNVCSQSTRFSVTSAWKNNIFPMFVLSQHVSVSPVLAKTTYFQCLYSVNTFQCHQCLQKQHISNVCSQSTRFSVTSAWKNNTFPMFVVSQHVSVSPVLAKTTYFQCL